MAQRIFRDDADPQGSMSDLIRALRYEMVVSGNRPPGRSGKPLRRGGGIVIDPLTDSYWVHMVTRDL
jgi:hypothetical protein